jgi:hypothetical protein
MRQQLGPFCSILCRRYWTFDGNVFVRLLAMGCQSCFGNFFKITRRPAFAEYWQRWTSWPATPAEFAARLLPAQEFVPLAVK